MVGTTLSTVGDDRWHDYLLIKASGQGGMLRSDFPGNPQSTPYWYRGTVSGILFGSQYSCGYSALTTAALPKTSLTGRARVQKSLSWSLSPKTRFTLKRLILVA